MANYFYEGLIVTSIATKTDPNDSTRVIFDEASPNGAEAVFLHKINQVNASSVEEGMRAFSATKVSPQAAKEIIDNNPKGKIPMFIVHGFTIEVSKLLGSKADQLSRFDKGAYYYPVPVMWSTDGNLNFGSFGDVVREVFDSVDGSSDKIQMYLDDQKTNAISAGKAMKSFVDLVDNDTFPRKSMIMHSMGNHVVFNGACAEETPDVQFDNIFMVAADVPSDIFQKNPTEPQNNVASQNKFKKATNFMGMLAKNPDNSYKGKVYVLWAQNDLLLTISSRLNRDNRIGFEGPGSIRAEYKDIVEEINVVGKGGLSGFVGDPIGHGYHLSNWAIDIYEEKGKGVV